MLRAANPNQSNDGARLSWVSSMKASRPSTVAIPTGRLMKKIQRQL